MAMPPAKRLLAASLSLLLGCAPVGTPKPGGKPAEPARAAPAAHGEIPAWRLDELAQSPEATLVLRAARGLAVTLDVAQARLIHATALKIAAAAGAGETPQWLLVGTPTINAYASYQNGQPVVAVTLGMARLLKDDAGAWAALLGHELAHFRLGHHQAQRTRQEAVAVGSTLAGLALTAVGLGVGSMAADAAGTLVERAFSRDDERDADRAGLGYARQAGLDAQGALRLQERLLAVSRDSSLSFLSTHPSGTDRVAAIRQLLNSPEAAGRRTTGSTGSAN